LSPIVAVRNHERDARSFAEDHSRRFFEHLQVMLREPIDEKLVRALDYEFALVDGREARGFEPRRKALRVHLGFHMLGG
jgi:hypothetical protein